MHLSRTERWLLANQYRILEALVPDEADWFRKARTVVEEGFAGEYEDICKFVYRDEYTRSEDGCHEVIQYSQCL